MSILSTQKFRECQGFIEKVGEINFNKVKHRQVNKFNNFIRKEGNIIGVSTQLTAFSQAGSQAGSNPPRDNTTSQAVSAVPWEGSSLVASQAGRFPPYQGQHYFPGSQHILLGRKQFSGLPDRQAGRFPPSQGQCYFPGSQHSSPSSPPFQEYPSQVGSGLGSSQAGKQAGESATSQEASVSSHNTPAGEDPSQAGNTPSTQAGKQAVRCSARCRAPGLPRE